MDENNYDKVDQFYSPERLAKYTDKELPTLRDLAAFDRDNENTIYGSRTRAATVATAQRSVDDITAEMKRRGLVDEAGE